MTLLEARVAYTRALGLLLVEANNRGLSIVIAETLRHPLVAKWNATHCRVFRDGKRCEAPIDNHPREHVFRPIGIEKSTHSAGLAADLYIIKEGEISNEVAQYQPLGAYWKSLGPDFRWGGDFKGFPDLGHFSHQWEGRS